LVALSLSPLLGAAPAAAQETDEPTGPVFAFESEPVDLILEDSVELYNNSEFTTGWVPSDSPLQIQFEIESVGGAWIEMEGTGRMGWPDGLTVSLEPIMETGEIVVDASLDAVTSIRFDVAGYEWESEIDRRGIGVEGAAFFDPFLLSGDIPDEVEVTYEGAVNELLSWSFNVFTGVNATFSVDLGPEAATTFHAENWYVDGERLAVAGETVVVEPLGEGIQPVEVELVGAWNSSLDLVLNPVFEVCVDIIGCWDLVDLDVPVPLAGDDFQQFFPMQTLDFPLPVLFGPEPEIDLGTVYLGQIQNVELPIENMGELDLLGTATMSGSVYYTNYPTTFQAAPGVVDGVVVTFAPQTEGTFEGVLQLASNDPLNPVTEVHFVGTAVDSTSTGPSTPGTDEEDDAEGRSKADPTVVTTEVKGCRCSSTGDSGGVAGLALFGLAGLVLVRRREQE
jgi:MYXO-CTERM domain-containing protein